MSKTKVQIRDESFFNQQCFTCPYCSKKGKLSCNIVSFRKSNLNTESPVCRRNEP